MATHNILLVIIFCLVFNSLKGQTTTITLSGADIKDATLYKDDRIGQEGKVNTNYGTFPRLSAAAWTNSGKTTFWRSLISFNLQAIPAGATIQSAKLFI